MPFEPEQFTNSEDRVGIETRDGEQTVNADLLRQPVKFASRSKIKPRNRSVERLTEFVDRNGGFGNAGHRNRLDAGRILYLAQGRSDSSADPLPDHLPIVVSPARLRMKVGSRRAR